MDRRAIIERRAAALLALARREQDRARRRVLCAMRDRLLNDLIDADRRSGGPAIFEDDGIDWYALSNGLGTVFPDGTRVDPED